MAKLQFHKGTKTYFVNIPKDRIRIMDWKKGDNIVIDRDGRRLYLEKVKWKENKD